MFPWSAGSNLHLQGNQVGNRAPVHRNNIPWAFWSSTRCESIHRHVGKKCFISAVLIWLPWTSKRSKCGARGMSGNLLPGAVYKRRHVEEKHGASSMQFASKQILSLNSMNTRTVYAFNAWWVLLGSNMFEYGTILKNGLQSALSSSHS